LLPLVVVRDGQTYRMIGGLVIEARSNGAATAQFYPERDYTNSVRMVSDGAGSVETSLGYDGDWGLARIDGQNYVSSDADMASFYRFQSQEAEIFPLAVLNINDTALEAWLDQLQLYHYPYRAYSAGLAVFLSHDSARDSVSPYSAFNANPANFIDSTGALWEWTRGLRPSTRDLIFATIWGVTTGALQYFLRPMYVGMSQSATSDFDSILLGGGRLVANVVTNVVFTHEIQIGSRTVLVRGPVALRRNSLADAGNADFINIIYLETAEATWSLGPSYGLVPFLPSDTGPAVGIFATLLGVGVVDLFWGRYRERANGWEFASYISDYEGTWFWAVARRNVTDAIFYTGVAVAWNHIVRPSDEGISAELVFSLLWVLRNASFRLLRRAVLSGLKRWHYSLHPEADEPRAFTPLEGEDARLYVDSRGHLFAWNYRDRTIRVLRNAEELVTAIRNFNSSLQRVRGMALDNLRRQHDRLRLESSSFVGGDSTHPQSFIRDEHDDHKSGENTGVP
jgi:RHS repeat-associated protein